MSNNGAKSKTSNYVDPPVVTGITGGICDAPFTRDKSLSSAQLEIIGMNRMADELRWHSEPIWPCRRDEIVALIEDAREVGNQLGIDGMNLHYLRLKDKLERAVASASELVEARMAAEEGMRERREEIQHDKERLQQEITDMDGKLEKHRCELRELTREAQVMLSEAGLNCPRVGIQEIDQSIDIATPLPNEVAGELGVAHDSHKSVGGILTSLIAEVAPVVVGCFVGIALGLVSGAMTLQKLRDPRSAALCVAVMLIGVVVTSVMSGALYTTTRIWALGRIRRASNELPAQMEACSTVIKVFIIACGLFVAGEATVEALAFIHLHNLMQLDHLRMQSEGANLAASARLLQVAMPFYFLLGLIISTPLLVYKCARAITDVQHQLVSDFIQKRRWEWKQSKRKEVFQAVATASDCASLQFELARLTELRTQKQRLLDDSPSTHNVAHQARIKDLEEQARGKAGHFWSYFEMVTEPPRPTKNDDTNEQNRNSSLGGSRTCAFSKVVRSLQRLLGTIFGRRAR